MSTLNSIELSNGDIVTLKEYATRGLTKQIQAKMLEGQKVGVNGDAAMEFDASKIIDVEDFTVISMIEKVEHDGQEVDITVEYLDDLRVEDYQLLKSEVDKRTKPQELGKD